MLMFDEKTILVTGGTGSFGNNFVRLLLKEYDAREIVVYSRDEKKQYDMRNALNDSRVSFVIGDIRDREHIRSAMKAVNYVFHAAALKQVPSCEFFPMEAVLTNVVGTHNVISAAEECGVEKLIVLSTDKAVYPINAMGQTKALMEKLILARAKAPHVETTFCGVRYGNVMCSRGSVIPLFIKQIKAGEPLTITDPDMTRLLLPLSEAVRLVTFAMREGRQGDMFVRKAQTATIGDLAQALLNLFDADNETKVVGVRAGEKQHEVLVKRRDDLLTTPRPEFLATRKEEALITRIKAVENQLAGAESSYEVALQQRARRLMGLLVWTLRTEYHERLTEFDRNLRSLDEAMALLHEKYDEFVRVRQAASHSYLGYDQPVDRLRVRARESIERIDILMARQGRILEIVAIDELVARRDHLRSYRDKARFALADSYDRATQAQARSEAP